MKKTKKQVGEELAAKIIKGDYAAACVELLAAEKAFMHALARFTVAKQMVIVTRKAALEVV